MGLPSAVMISRTVTTDPKKGGSGTEITVTGKAFADGTGTLFSQAGLCRRRRPFVPQERDGRGRRVRDHRGCGGPREGDEQMARAS